ncbi:hypothetical protein LDO26_08090 [Luteimonas sp. BDR2-5]|uniref:hypothetical protein n=1 Tax=Proluteimonas luteida TaxID=2878685 RepID=UPI001E2E7E3F|nr:hypothetical protein [Luteimonas sp. BDR2-5]MCD9028168.1 hypothetical protein [Luteimonas sp. BDR2-5]
MTDDSQRPGSPDDGLAMAASGMCRRLRDAAGLALLLCAFLLATLTGPARAMPGAAGATPVAEGTCGLCEGAEIPPAVARRPAAHATGPARTARVAEPVRACADRVATAGPALSPLHGPPRTAPDPDAPPRQHRSRAPPA